MHHLHFSKRALPGLLLATLLCLLAPAVCKAQADYKQAGEAGMRIDLRQQAVRGKYTIFDFSSEYCGPCRNMAVTLQKLGDLNPRDTAIRRIDINRPGVVGIDWESPVAKQFDLHSIPKLLIYGPDRNLLSDEDAKKWLMPKVQVLANR